MKILLGGFEPFGHDGINPSKEAVHLVKDEIKGVEIVKCDVPVVFGEAEKKVYDLMKELRPDAVLCVGQAGGRNAITPERVAINCDDTRIPDNKGEQPIDRKICEHGKNAYFSTLPIRDMVEAMRKEGIRSEISNSAGTFVCNHLMYQVCRYIEEEFPNMIGGFLHVPYLPEQAAEGVPSMTLDEITRGIEVSLETIIDHLKERKV